MSVKLDHLAISTSDRGCGSAPSSAHTDNNVKNMIRDIIEIPAPWRRPSLYGETFPYIIH